MILKIKYLVVQLYENFTKFEHIILLPVTLGLMLRIRCKIFFKYKIMKKR